MRVTVDLKKCMAIAGSYALLLLLATGLQARISTVEVESEGTGSTLQNAVNVALVEAVAQVNGKALTSVTELNSLQITAADGNEEAYFASDKYQQQVRSATSGSVASYQILQQRRDENQQYEVVLLVKVGQYKKSQKAERKRIAVLPLHYTRDYYALSGTQMPAAKLTRLVEQEWVNYLVQSRKFTVLDREFVQQTMGELKLAKSSATPTEELARLGQTLVADYVLVGVIEQFGIETQSRSSQFNDMVFSNTSGAVHISYRLIEVATQQVVVSDSQQQRYNADQLAAGGNFDIGLATNRMVDDSAKSVAGDILSQIYPIAVIAVDGSTLVLGQGGKSLKPGERYKIYRMGDALYDPYTKEYLGRNESYCCEVEIVRVTAKQSYAELIGSDSDLAEKFSPKTYILRERVAKSQQTGGDNNSSPKKEAAAPGVRELREQQSSGSDW